MASSPVIFLRISSNVFIGGTDFSAKVLKKKRRQIPTLSVIIQKEQSLFI